MLGPCSAVCYLYCSQFLFGPYFTLLVSFGVMLRIFLFLLRSFSRCSFFYSFGKCFIDLELCSSVFSLFRRYFIFGHYFSLLASVLLGWSCAPQVVICTAVALSLVLISLFWLVLELCSAVCYFVCGWFLVGPYYTLLVSVL